MNPFGGKAGSRHNIKQHHERCSRQLVQSAPHKWMCVLEEAVTLLKWKRQLRRNSTSRRTKMTSLTLRSFVESLRGCQGHYSSFTQSHACILIAVYPLSDKCNLNNYASTVLEGMVADVREVVNYLALVR